MITVGKDFGGLIVHPGKSLWYERINRKVQRRRENLRYQQVALQSTETDASDQATRLEEERTVSYHTNSGNRTTCKVCPNAIGRQNTAADQLVLSPVIRGQLNLSHVLLDR